MKVGGDTAGDISSDSGFKFKKVCGGSGEVSCIETRPEGGSGLNERTAAATIESVERFEERLNGIFAPDCEIAK